MHGRHYQIRSIEQSNMNIISWRWIIETTTQIPAAGVFLYSGNFYAIILGWLFFFSLYFHCQFTRRTQFDELHNAQFPRHLAPSPICFPEKYDCLIFLCVFVLSLPVRLAHSLFTALSPCAWFIGRTGRRGTGTAKRPWIIRRGKIFPTISFLLKVYGQTKRTVTGCIFVARYIDVNLKVVTFSFCFYFLRKSIFMRYAIMFKKTKNSDNINEFTFVFKHISTFPTNWWDFLSVRTVLGIIFIVSNVGSFD